MEALLNLLNTVVNEGYISVNKAEFIVNDCKKNDYLIDYWYKELQNVWNTYTL